MTRNEFLNVLNVQNIVSTINKLFESSTVSFRLAYNILTLSDEKTINIIDIVLINVAGNTLVGSVYKIPVEPLDQLQEIQFKNTLEKIIKDNLLKKYNLGTQSNNIQIIQDYTEF